MQIMNYKNYLFVLITLLITSCSYEPEVETTVYDDFILQNVVLTLKEQGINYKIDENKLYYFQKDNDRVNGIFLNAYENYSPKYVVYSIKRKDKFSLILNRNNVEYRIIERPNNGFGFLIQSKISDNKLRSLFMNSFQ